MEDDDNEILHELGAFEPMLAKRVIEKLEEENIPFELEVDNSALADPSRGVKIYLFMTPEGSKVLIFVPESHLSRATELVKAIFPE